ncbi:Fur family transcriptional regulator [Limnochorda pilosa]|uniref:Fur family transcriptional regulator n=1 Tax=Limnochorda pilosa TaxID=1555112 RepID=A0A0K2SJL2_LIMPI|nr:transcriptional repressor [Limnochorda pilosa]BAS27301.1 Fur family transcriptional regulator [Limnochorda pilosa]
MSIQQQKRPRFLRHTRQREAILRVLRMTHEHPTADWIYQEVRKEIPHISLGTVYRNLKILTEMGEAQEMSYGSSYSRYDGDPRLHYHFVCDDCGRIEDLEMPLVEGLEAKAAEWTDGRIESHRLEFHGLCRECNGR